MSNKQDRIPTASFCTPHKKRIFYELLVFILDSVQLHVSTPLSEGLFQRAVIQSAASGVLTPVQVG